MNATINEKANEELNERLNKYFHQFKIYFFNLIKGYVNSLKYYKIDKWEADLSCNTANNHLNEYINRKSKANDSNDLCYLIMINLCFTILDLLYNSSFNTVHWFMNTINGNYKNLVKGKNSW